MFKKLIEFKALILNKIDSFRKSLFFELLMTSKRWTVLAFAFGLASVVLNLSTSALFIPSMLRVLDPKQKIHIFDKIDYFAEKFFVIDEKYYFYLFLFIFIFMLLKVFFQIMRESFGLKIVVRHSLYLKRRILSFLNSKEISFFVREGSSIVLSSLESYLYNSMIILNLGLTVTLSFCTLVFALILMFAISWPLTSLVAFLCIPLFVVSRRSRNTLRKGVADWSVGVKSMNQDHVNYAAGIRYLKLANKEESESLRMLEKSKKPFEGFSLFTVMAAFIGQTNELFGVICLFLMVIFFFVNPWQIFSVSSGIVFSFLLVLARGIQSYNSFIGAFNGFSLNFSFLKKIEDLLYDKKEMDTNWGSLSLSSFESHIQFQKVSFVYPQTKKNVLNTIDLTFPKEKHIAIVGPSGSGKSTLVDLVLGFYRPTDGEILVNGKNYQEYKIKDYRKLFGLVSQESNMFFPSIRENLILFKPEATELELRRALDQADALEFIDKLPEGIDTVIGERGVKLSGGQKQRLSIARALLHDPQILIFDEATSSLDSLSEARIIESIKKASVGRTSITVAHRLSTVMHCDKIVFLDNGCVLEEGTPQELMAKHSRFRKYAESQNLKMSG